ANVWGLPCTGIFVTSCATTEICVLYVPTFKPLMVGITLKETDCPLCTKVPDVAESFNHDGELAIVAFQFNGQLQLPEAVIVTDCGLGSDAPCTALKARALAEGCSSVHGGKTTS